MPVLFSQTHFREAQSCDSERPSFVPLQIAQHRHQKAIASAPFQPSIIRPQPLSRDQLIRHKVLLAFCDPLPQHCLQLQALSMRQWKRLLRWLDISGLALCFFDRVSESQLGNLLPGPVFARLQQNLSDNTKRTRGMITESIAIQKEFQADCLRYAVLKGLSHWPGAVPRPELRSQFDLDFLVVEKDVQGAQRILERRGYRLYATSGRSLEFKRNEFPGISLKDMYKDTGSWAVELHVKSCGSSSPSLFDRLEWREFGGFSMPVLSPVDLFLGQGLHAYKHICSEFSRAAHLLEFRRHVLFRGCDESFWNDLQARAAENPRSSVALGVITLLITEVMGKFAPEALTSWTVSRLPRPARLWVNMYGHRAVLESFPGSKLYLLLQQELENSGLTPKRSVRQSLIPSRLPPPVIRASPNELLSSQLRRYRMQINLFAGRLRFHLVEGIRFVWELNRWRRHLNQVAQ